MPKPSADEALSGLLDKFRTIQRALDLQFESFMVLRPSPKAQQEREELRAQLETILASTVENLKQTEARFRTYGADPMLLGELVSITEYLDNLHRAVVQRKGGSWVDCPSRSGP